MSASSAALVDALGLALVHSSWQLSVVACGLWLLLHLLDGAPATARHALCVMGLFFAPALFIGTVLVSWDTPAVEFSALAVFSSSSSRLDPLSPADLIAPSSSPFSLSGSTWMVVLWVVGMVLFGVRFIVGFLQARSLRLHGHCAVSSDLEARVCALGRSVGVPFPVQVVASLQVTVPMVVGLFRPLILLPPSALTGLTPDQLESVLLHELAHIRRRDLWVGFIQGLVEVMLFFHPAVWWMSHRLRAERELCCDDIVLAQGASGRVYARALLQLAEQHRHPSHSAAATDGSLRFRVERLVGRPRAPQRGIRGLAAVVLFCCVGLLSAQQSLASDDDLTQMVGTLLEMDISIPAGEERSLAEDSAMLRDRLDTLLSQRQAIQDRMETLMAEDPARWGLTVALRSAQVDEHVADMIASSDIPSQLTETQASVYQAALSQRSARFRSDALASYQSAAAMPGPSVLLAEARSGVARLQAPLLPADADFSALDTESLLARATSTGPDAPDVGRLWLATAERLFDEGDATSALVWYTAASDHLSQESAIFARYKVAWCHYNMGHTDNAITALEAVAEANAGALQQAVLTDLVHFYVTADRAQEGRRSFVRKGEQALWDQVAQTLPSP